MFHPSILLVLLVLPCATANAQLAYEFLELTPEKTVVATLTLAELPAEVNDFVSLQFTDRGQELFGFGETYLGEFDALGAFDSFISDRRDFDGQEINGLRGAGEDQGATAIDLDPPPSSLADVIETSVFRLHGSAAHDWMSLRYLDVGGENRVTVEGHWNSVPEPNIGWFPFAIAGGILFFRRRRSVSSV